MVWTQSPHFRLIKTNKQCDFTETFPLSHSKKKSPDSPGLKLLTKPILLFGLVPFDCPSLPLQMYFCRIRAQQEEVSQDKVSRRSEEWDEIGERERASPSSADIRSPVSDLCCTTVYRTSMLGWILWIWDKTIVTSNITPSSKIWEQASRNARPLQTCSLTSPHKELLITDITLKSWHFILKRKKRETDELIEDNNKRRDATPYLLSWLYFNRLCFHFNWVQ